MEIDRIKELRLKAALAKKSFLSGQQVLNQPCRQDIENAQSAEFASMLRHVRDHSSFYRDFYGDHGVWSRRQVNVQDLPVLTKELLMENFDQIVTVPGITRKGVDDFIAEGSSWIHDERWMYIKSTGTSGYHTLNVLTIDELAAISGLFRRRLPVDRAASARCAFLFGRDPSHLSYKFSCISAPVLNEALHVPTQQSVDQIVAALHAFRPTAISSFPSTLRVLIEEVKAHRLHLPSGITVMSSGEMLDDALKEDFRAHLGITPFNMYACIEASPIAQDCPLHELHINEDHFIVEASPLGGLVTNLINRSVPVLRFRFDDLFTIDDTRCACGSSLHRLKLSDAKRTGQFFIKDASGTLKKVNTMIFKDVLYKFPDIIQSQVQQISPDSFLIRAYSRSVAEGLRHQILDEIEADLLRYGIEPHEASVDLAFTEPSEMSALNGKVKHFIPWKWGASVSEIIVR